jgi:hypothetical protein
VGPAGPQGATGAAGPQGATGAAGANGQNSLVKTTTEPAANNCPNGGVKLEYGLDANGNGTLDAGEVNSALTKYVCNGAAGATGATGATGPAGPQGATGAQGATGNAGPAGPQGATGAAGPQGATGAAGANGQNSLVKTTTEPAANNCPNGGVKLEYGLDANGNGTLDLGEINSTLTKYVCNGATGATGATGSAGPAGPQGAAGAQGAAGLNTLVKTTVEDVSNACAAGGVKLEYGLDSNANGTLDTGEINASLTQYVCNGFQGDTGPAGPAGPAGPSGIGSIVAFSGSVGSIAAGSASYVFAGPTTSVTISSNTQRLTGSAVAGLGLALGAANQNIRVGLCYQFAGAAANGPITNFVGNSYTNAIVTTTRTLFPAAASVTGLAPATYNVGFCVLNAGNSVVGSNDYANGWIMVTN